MNIMKSKKYARIIHRYDKVLLKELKEHIFMDWKVQHFERCQIEI